MNSEQQFGGNDVAKEDWEALVDFLEDLRAVERFERIKESALGGPEAFLDLEELKQKVLKNRIKEARRSRGVRQVELAGRLGCKQSYVSKIEQPGCRPRIETLKKVARALGCGVEELI